jgi:CitB family two-component system response regulator CitT
MYMFHVVIAEDDFRVAQIHEEYLSQVEGMKLVGKAVNANDTLQLLKEYRVDLLLLDVYMPDQLGTELLHNIRAQFPNIDIIMITAAKEKAFLEKAISYGVQYYLIKPVTLDQFKEAMVRFKKKKEMLGSLSEINQEVLNQVFGSDVKVADKNERLSLPSGIDYLTLDRVRSILELEKDGITSEKAGEKMGASRTTARRYLEYLVGIEQATVEHFYGIVGRPERRYYYR